MSMDDETLEQPDVEQVPEAEKQNEPLSLLDAAKEVLQHNNVGGHTIPAEGLYPHQWLWDSCFIAIGLRHVDLDLAKSELLSLLRGQWHNGMLAHMVLVKGNRYARDTNIWHSSVNPY